MTIVKGSVSLMKLLIWEVSNGCSYLLDPLRKDIQDKKKLVPLVHLRLG